MRKMKALLLSADYPQYLHRDAIAALKQARSHYEQMPSVGPTVIESLNGVCFLPWEGTAIHKTLTACAKAEGIKAEISRDGLLVTYGGCTLADVKAHWQRVANGTFTPLDLISFIGDPRSERFDELVPPDLLVDAHINEFLDIPGAREAVKFFL